MKHIIIAILFSLGIMQVLYAQKDTVKVAKVDSVKHKKKGANNTLSLNISSFVQQVSHPNTTPNLTGSFLYYTRNFNTFFLRAGVNGWIGQNTQTNSQTSETTTQNNFYASASLGFYFKKNISRRLGVAYGINVFYAHTDSSNTYASAFDQVKLYTTSNHYGVTPGVILQYKFTKRIAAFVEYLLPVQKIVSVSGTNYSLFPNDNATDRKNAGYSILVYNPISFYLSCSF